MTSTMIPSMIVENVEPRSRPGTIYFARDPLSCDHVWEARLWDTGRAYCPRCGSTARWVNDPRLEGEP